MVTEKGTELNVIYYTIHPSPRLFFNHGGELCIMKVVVDNSLRDTETLIGINNSVIWYCITILVICLHIIKL